jgi:hypothetical protein
VSKVRQVLELLYVENINSGSDGESNWYIGCGNHMVVVSRIVSRPSDGEIKW